jgi:hypothetical protein
MVNNSGQSEELALISVSRSYSPTLDLHLGKVTILGTV